MNEDTDVAHMRRALRLAARAAGRTSPNPLVGAIVVRDGEVVGEGYHHAAGEPHAEVLALEKAGAAARGGTLYTNLEPCAHTGRTPPCVTAIKQAGVARVVAAMRDPDPRTNGKGFRALRDAGIAVTDGVLAADARTPTNSKVVRAKDPQRTVIFVARDADVRRTNRLRDAGVSLVTVPRSEGGLDLGVVLRWLGEHGVNTVLSEAGPRVAGALVRGGLADRLLFLLAPVAGGEGAPALAGVADATALQDVRVRRLGADIAVEGALP